MEEAGGRGGGGRGGGREHCTMFCELAYFGHGALLVREGWIYRQQRVMLEVMAPIRRGEPLSNPAIPNQPSSPAASWLWFGM